MIESKPTRKAVSDAIAKGVRSAEELPLVGGSAPSPLDSVGQARLAAVRERVRGSLSSPTTYGRARRIPAGHSAGEGSPLSIPRMDLYGPPLERARQAGTLLKPVLRDLLGEFLRQASPGVTARWGMLAFLSLMARRVPSDLRAEIQALARAGGVSTPGALALTVMGDFHAALGCSTIIAEPPLTAPGCLLFGRNLDFIGYGLSDAAAMLAVHHPNGESGEIPHASLGWVGLWGIHTGWNAAGLCLGNMQVYNPGPDSPSGRLHMLSRRTPTSWAYALLLRSCSTVQEALDTVGRIAPLSPTNLMLADATGDAAVVEWDLGRHRVRRPERGRLFATNFFLDPGMRGEEVECWRLLLLQGVFADLDHASETPAGLEKLEAQDLIRLLDAVDQGDLTLHSVVFEPLGRRVHFSAATPPPSTRGLWDTLSWDLWNG